MGFHDVEFSRDISYGSRSSLIHNTAIVEVASGAEERVARWTSPRMRYDVGYGVKRNSDLIALIAFHRARQGRAYSFRFWDPLDYSTNPLQTPGNDATVLATNVDELIGTGDGTVTTFQLVKRYTSGAVVRVRNLTKPITGTVVIAKDTGSGPVNQTSGFTVNYSTGVVTFTTPPANGDQITAGCKFDVPVRFEEDELSISLDSFDEGSVVTGVNVIEEVSDAVVDDDFYYRGASFQTFSGPLDITPQMGYFVRLSPTTSGLWVNLPQFTNYEEGGPHWKFKNESGANTILVKYLCTTLFTLQVAGDANRRDFAEIFLGLDGAGARTWLGIT
jgi:uncharacterized protein (TIGR02217 family)